MRLLQRSETGEFSFRNLVGDDTIPPYAILSHTWGLDTEEVAFEDMIKGTGEQKPGYEKIRFCGEQAKQDGLQYFWIDTCCINKENDAELARSINSMFRWYRNATQCYVYLSDVSSAPLNTKRECNPRPWESDFWKPTWFTWDWIVWVVISLFRWYYNATIPDVSRMKRKGDEVVRHAWESDFQRSRWFTRGWTLQELLAPASVKFFSREGKRLGDKSSLRQQIYEITNISLSALQGAHLSQFSVEERLKWIEHRRTKLEEDKAYSLLGIFDVYILPIYGEGAVSALDRLLDEFHRVQKCIQELHLTDPRDDKKRIEDTKGGLLEDSYSWILENSQFQKWRDDQQSRLLWIKGDPGKGKTMLLCGIVNELKKSLAKSSLLSYFFCQATDSRINNATAVLRGLIYLLVAQQRSLISHVQKKYDQAGKALFEDANAWVALSEIFINILHDPGLESAYLVIDALDECVTDLPKLLDFIIYTSSSSTRVKWLLSSRNELHIKQKLRSTDKKARLSLELRENAEQVSHAVNVYIDDKLSHVESLQDNSLRDRVGDILRRKANGTFLWVALVVHELEMPGSWDPLQIVEDVPMDLHQLYDRMVTQIQKLPKRNFEVCRRMLSMATVAYRPLYLAELGSLCELPDETPALTTVRTIVAMCGSFLTVRDDQAYLIHQSAKDYLSDEARATIFPSQEKTHHDIFLQSLKLMSSSLHRDMYRLVAPGYLIDQVQVPAKDPLATTRYSCVYWIDHLYNSVSNKSIIEDNSFQDGGVIHIFLQKQYLYWLEALSLCRSMSEGVVSMTKLEALSKVILNPPSLCKNIC
jgi:hypothetical protein